MPGIVGTKPNQVPTNGDLGPLAFRDENPVGDVVGTSDIQVLSGKSFSDNVGIGTSSPVTPLDVRTSTGASIIAGRTGNTGPASEPGNFEVRAPNASGTEMIWNQINAVINTATAGSEASSMLFKTRSGGAFATRMRLDANGNTLIGRSDQSSGGKLEVGGNVVLQPAAAAPALGTNGDMSFQLVSDTSLKILVRGSDGVTRSTTLTLA